MVGLVARLAIQRLDRAARQRRLVVHIQSAKRRPTVQRQMDANAGRAGLGVAEGRRIELVGFVGAICRCDLIGPALERINCLPLDEVRGRHPFPDDDGVEIVGVGIGKVRAVGKSLVFGAELAHDLIILVADGVDRCVKIGQTRVVRLVGH